MHIPLDSVLAVLALLVTAVLPLRAQQSPQTLLAIFAHPDDERIIGPLLAQNAREGHRVALVIATDGRKGIREHAGIPAGDELARVRAEEARCAAQKLGIPAPILLGLEDAGLASFTALRQLRQEVERIVREVQPDMIITFGPEGGTGHPDHRLVGNVVTEVVQSGGDSIRAGLYYASLPAERLRSAPPSRPTVTGVPGRYLTLRIPFKPEDLAAARESFACHRTQYTMEEMAALNRTLDHAYAGSIHLRPWYQQEPRR